MLGTHDVDKTASCTVAKTTIQTDKKSSSRPATASQPTISKQASLPTSGPRTTLVICPLSVLSNWEVCMFNELDVQ